MPPYFEKNIDFSCSFLGYCLIFHPIYAIFSLHALLFTSPGSAPAWNSKLPEHAKLLIISAIGEEEQIA
jgi:hypothetical protein